MSRGGVPRPTVQTAERGSQLIRAARPELIDDDAADLRGIAVQLDATIAPLLAGATIPSWVGESADNYDTARDGLHKVLLGCSDALAAAAGAMETYAAVVRWAHGQAQGAIDDYRTNLTAGNQYSKLIEANAVVAEANRAVSEADTELRVALQALSAFLPRPDAPLSDALRSAGDWWHGLDPWQQILVTAAFAAIVAASGGSIGVAFGAAGVASFGLEHAHGAATFTEDPGTATRNYLETVTPAQAAWDAGETALTFGPGAFGGALLGAGVRHAAANPRAISDQVRTINWADDTGAVTPAAFLRRDPIDLANGTTLQPLDAQAQAAAAARYEELPASHLRAGGAAGAYQRAVYGESERGIALENIVGARGKFQMVYPDGFTPAYGAIGDAKFVSSANSSFYLPDSMGKPSLERLAILDMDRRLDNMAAAARVHGGNGVIEITTNHPAAASFIEARMRALNIPGYVRLMEG